MIHEIFETQFQTSPASVWEAPGRVNLIGEHTDYNQGFVLPMAIENTTQVAVARNDKKFHRIYSANKDELIQSSTEELETSGWGKYPLGVIKLMGIQDQCFDIALSSDVPIGAGLSSSAALECSVASALNELMNLGLERLQLAKICQRAENEVVGAPTGNMDQIASLFGKPDKAVFIDCQTEDIETIELGFEDANLQLMVIDTGTSHDLSDGDYGNRRTECYSAAAALGLSSLRHLKSSELAGIDELLSETETKRARHIVSENGRVLEAVQAIRDQDFSAFGRLMTESHASMRDDFEISTSELDTAVDASLAAGALGARMTGGGFGGSAIALIHTNDFQSVKTAVGDGFEKNGFKSPSIFIVQAADGARKINYSK